MTHICCVCKEMLPINYEWTYKKVNGKGYDMHDECESKFKVQKHQTTTEELLELEKGV